MKQLSKQFFLLITLGVIIILVIGVFVLQNQPQEVVEAPEEQGENVENASEQVDIANWKIFNSDEVGITFEYPAEWGSIVEKVDDMLCLEEGDQKLSERLCRRVYFSVEKSDHIFLVTETEGYTQTLTNGSNGRGATWYEKLRYQSESNYCDNNPYLSLDLNPEDCERFETKNSIRVTKIARPVPFTDDQTMTIFLFKSMFPNALYKEFIFSSVELKKDMDITEHNEMKLIDSIIFF